MKENVTRAIDLLVADPASVELGEQLRREHKAALTRAGGIALLAVAAVIGVGGVMPITLALTGLVWAGAIWLGMTTALMQVRNSKSM